MKLFALLGRPIGHSLSPEIHNPLFRAHDIDATYILVEPPPSARIEIGPLVRRLGLDGVNLTVPFKEVAIPWLTEISRTARAVGAVNVVVRDGDSLIGDNTDADGFVASLLAERGGVPPGDVVVLGAGGSARAVAAGLAAFGVTRIHLLNREAARAEQVAAELAACFPGCALTGGALDAPSLVERSRAAGLLVNCTSGTAAERIGAHALHALPPHAVVCDINYWMARPPLLGAAAARGLTTLDGLPMLAHQGVLAFARFTGIHAEAGPVLAHLRRVLVAGRQA